MHTKRLAEQASPGSHSIEKYYKAHAILRVEAQTLRGTGPHGVNRRRYDKGRFGVYCPLSERQREIHASVFKLCPLLARKYEVSLCMGTQFVPVSSVPRLECFQDAYRCCCFNVGSYAPLSEEPGEFNRHVLEQASERASERASDLTGM